MNLQNAAFVRSAADKASFPADGIPQVAFAGRSNVGKSSVLNRVLNRKKMAYVGSTPGKTVHVNYFLIDSRFYLVDLPGYGYAQVSKQERQRWARLMEDYFASDQLSLGVLIVDARHKPTAQDQEMAAFFADSGKPWLVVANKLDKLKAREVEPNLALIRQTLSLGEDAALIPFSALKGTGRDQLVSAILNTIDSQA